MVRTSVRTSLFAPIVGSRVELRPAEVDTGLVQYDSLSIDEEHSARDAARFYATFDRRVDDDAALLRRERIDVVIGDVPPLAFAAAARAGLPSVAVANFTWDWIYGIYPAFDRLAPDVPAAIRSAYAETTRALRLPLHGGFDAMADVTIDIPFIARRSTRDRAETRRAIGVDADERRPVVLPSFGAYGAALPLDEVRRAGRLIV